MDNGAVSHDARPTASRSGLSAGWTTREPGGKCLSLYMVTFGTGTCSCVSINWPYAEFYSGLDRSGDDDEDFSEHSFSNEFAIDGLAKYSCIITRLCMVSQSRK